MSAMFKKARKASPLSNDEATRQGHAVRAAQAAFADMAMIRSFLNDHHVGLGGRPLDLASQSEAGLKAVEATIYSERHLRGRPT